MKMVCRCYINRKAVSDMEREKIIKALECCTADHLICGGCHYYSLNFCMRCMKEDALSLIRELIEDNENLNQSCTNLIQTIKDVQADTIRKMAERLKLYYNNLSGTTSPVLTAYHIDQVAKEMLDGYAEPFGIMEGIKKKMMEDERNG